MRQIKLITATVTCFMLAACNTPNEIRELSTYTSSALSELNKELGKAQKNSAAANKLVGQSIGDIKKAEATLTVLSEQASELGGILNLGKGAAQDERKKLYDALIHYTALREQEIQVRLEGTTQFTKQAQSGLKPIKVPKSELQQVAAKLAELRENNTTLENLKSLFKYMVNLSREIKEMQKASASN